MLGVGAKKKTYLDDLFSTYIYTGTSANQTVNNGIDLSGEGGMTWLKARSSAYDHWLFDTARGSNKGARSNLNDAELTDTTYMNSFNSNGFTVGSNGSTNYSGVNFSSWSFRKAPGFFDIVTYTGNGANARAISHSLGSVPGMVIVKALNDSSPWTVYHKEIGPTKYLYLNDTQAAATDEWWGEGAATFTASNFYVQSTRTNANNTTFVAYVFAGGESTAATARSVDFDGTGDYLSLPNDSDLDLGTNDFTFETWIYPTEMGSGQNYWIYGSNDDAFYVYVNDNKAYVYGHDGTGLAGSIFLNSIESPANVNVNQWSHIAVTRNSNVFRLFLNGIKFHESTTTQGFESPGSTNPTIGRFTSSAHYFFKGKISNLRVVKGTAVYTSSFRPPTEPLTNITNTKLLCCNNSSTTGSTVTPGTITANGDPTASTDSPFDDPAGFVFGESGSENVIKCGSYKGSGSAGLEVNVGWEPSWLMIKATSRTGDWYIMDSIRGVVTSGNDEYVKANGSDAEGSADVIEFTSTGFKVISTGTHWNNSAETYSFTAIRRSDGYVGKPVELGTGVFAMDTGAGSSTIPNFDSGFPVDLAITRAPADTTNWETGGRLIQGKWLETNRTVAESPGSYFTFDSNTGWMSGATAYNSSYQAWMWKRHAGLDVVTYAGSEMTGGRQIPHSMGVTPEMMWVFRRNGDDNWAVYHKGLNGSTNPEQYDIHLNLTNAEADNTTWNDTAPTATHFSVSPNSNEVNQDNKDYIAMLFASTDVSKVGYYTGNGSTQTITTGFQPRFAIIRRVDGSEDHWVVLDTTRGWGSGNDEVLKLNSSAAQSAFDAGAPTSTGFSLTSDGWVNYSTGKFIYYAHA